MKIKSIIAVFLAFLIFLTLAVPALAAPTYAKLLPYSASYEGSGIATMTANGSGNVEIYIKMSNATQKTYYVYLVPDKKVKIYEELGTIVVNSTNVEATFTKSGTIGEKISVIVLIFDGSILNTDTTLAYQANKTLKVTIQ